MASPQFFSAAVSSGSTCVQVADDAVVGGFEDGRALVVVDRDDHLGLPAADHVLHLPGQAHRQVQLGLHGLAADADVALDGQPVLVLGDAAGAGQFGLQAAAKLLGQVQVLLVAEAAAHGDQLAGGGDVHAFAADGRGAGDRDPGVGLDLAGLHRAAVAAGGRGQEGAGRDGGHRRQRHFFFADRQAGVEDAGGDQLAAGNGQGLGVGGQCRP